MNTESKISETGGCPCVEELSTLHDGQGTAAVAAHAATCAICQSVLASYKKLDSMVVEAVKPSADLAGRIKSRCRHEAKNQQRTLVMWPREHAWKIAAAAAACMAVGGLLMMTPKDSDTQRPGARVAAKPNLPNGNVPSIASTSSSDTRIEIQPSGTSRGTIRTPRGTEGSTSGTRTVGVAPAADTDSGIAAIQSVGESVQHVWVVKDVTQAGEIFRANIPRHHSAVTDVSADGRIMFRIVINDRDMQSFVDRLNNAGLSLVSPALPQPGAAQTMQVFGKSVLYTVEFVPAESR